MAPKKLNLYASERLTLHSGYSCLDHHLEGDTCTHSFEVLADIISDEACKGMVIDVGMPVRHRNVLYNARCLCTYKHVYFIRQSFCATLSVT